MNEDQGTIVTWAIETFGQPKDVKTIVDRFITEAIELDTKAAKPLINIPDIQDECADCLIVLYQVAAACGFNLNRAVDYKMQINRARKWELKGDGTAQHID